MRTLSKATDRHKILRKVIEEILRHTVNSEQRLQELYNADHVTVFDSWFLH